MVLASFVPSHAVPKMSAGAPATMKVSSVSGSVVSVADAVNGSTDIINISASKTAVNFNKLFLINYVLLY